MDRQTETPKTAAPPPPAHLSERAAALWSAIAGRRARSPERLALLCFALEALDLASAARAQIVSDGVVEGSKRSRVTRVHPAVRVEAQARAEFLKIWGVLGLAWDGDLDA
jgi:phage terminase small subunit